MTECERDGLLFRVESHTVCVGPDGAVKWEADTEPVTVTYAGLRDDPQLRAMADQILEEAADGRDEHGA